jgi:hypothetical protein
MLLRNKKHLVVFLSVGVVVLLVGAYFGISHYLVHIDTQKRIDLFQGIRTGVKNAVEQSGKKEYFSKYMEILEYCTIAKPKESSGGALINHVTVLSEGKEDGILCIPVLEEDKNNSNNLLQEFYLSKGVGMYDDTYNVLFIDQSATIDSTFSSVVTLHELVHAYRDIHGATTQDGYYEEIVAYDEEFLFLTTLLSTTKTFKEYKEYINQKEKGFWDEGHHEFYPYNQEDLMFVAKEIYPYTDERSINDQVLTELWLYLNFSIINDIVPDKNERIQRKKEFLEQINTANKVLL